MSGVKKRRIIQGHLFCLIYATILLLFIITCYSEYDSRILSAEWYVGISELIRYSVCEPALHWIDLQLHNGYDKLVIRFIMESKYLWKAMSLSLHS